MENMGKGLTVPKWVLIVWPKIPQMPQNLSAKSVCPSLKILDFNEKRLHWASVVRGYNDLLFFITYLQIGNCLADDGDVCHDEDRSPVVAAHCNCEDRKCNDKYDGLGQCIDMKSYTSSAWGLEYLEKTYDLSTPFESGLCSPGTVTPNGPPRDDQCCKCLRRKKCLNVKCEKKFNGQGKTLMNHQ